MSSASFRSQPMEEWICQLCHQGAGIGRILGFPLRCALRNKREIRLPLQIILWPATQGHGIQRSTGLGLFLLELKSHRGKFLKDNTTAITTYQERTIITFSTPSVLSLSRTMQTGGS